MAPKESSSSLCSQPHSPSPSLEQTGFVVLCPDSVGKRKLWLLPPHCRPSNCVMNSSPVLRPLGHARVTLTAFQYLPFFSQVTLTAACSTGGSNGLPGVFCAQAGLLLWEGTSGLTSWSFHRPGWGCCCAPGCSSSRSLWHLHRARETDVQTGTTEKTLFAPCHSVPWGCWSKLPALTYVIDG